MGVHLTDYESIDVEQLLHPLQIHVRGEAAVHKVPSLVVAVSWVVGLRLTALRFHHKLNALEEAIWNGTAGANSRPNQNMWCQ